MAPTWPRHARNARFAGVYALHLDVVHGVAGVAAITLDDVGHRRLAQHLAGGGCRLLEDALRPAAERAVEELDDLQHGDLRRGAGEGVAALDAALGLQHAGAPQDGEELLEELDRDAAALGQLTDRHGRLAALS